jgi:hypothetical protein
MSRRSSSAAPASSSSSSSSAGPQATLAPGAWPFGTARPAGAPAPAPAAPAAAPTPGKRAKVSFDQVKVEKGVPIPSRVVTSTNEGQKLLESMAPGDMVRVNAAQAKSLCFAARRAKLPVTTRRLSATELGVWRLK